MKHRTRKDLERRITFLDGSVESLAELVVAQGRDVSVLRAGMVGVSLLLRKLAERGILTEAERADMEFLVSGTLYDDGPEREVEAQA